MMLRHYAIIYYIVCLKVNRKNKFFFEILVRFM